MNSQPCSKTTPKRGQDEKPVSVTPQNRGTGSHGSYQTLNKPAHYRGYLREDIKKSSIVPIKTFLEALGLPKEQADNGNIRYNRIAGSQAFKTRLEAYLRLAKNEEERYGPYVDLVGYVLTELKGKHLDVCRNDPAEIKGSFAGRSPDIVIVPNAAFSRGDRINADDFSKSGPTGELAELAFHWSELLHFIELKKINLEFPEEVPDTTKSMALETVTTETWPDQKIKPPLARDFCT